MRAMPESAATSTAPLLEIQELTVSFPQKGGGRFKAANALSLSIYPGQTLSIVGESGSGKSVSAMSVLGLIPHPPAQTESGRVLWSENPAAKPHRDLLKLTDREMRSVRGNEIAMIFQEPMTSLNPVYTVGEQVMEAVLLHQHVGHEAAVKIAEAALRDVGIADPVQRMKEYPHQLSGGMRQRVMIAMALACQPRLLLADEPTTALDVTIQAQILELLRKIQREKKMAVMLITHDLGVVAENADVVAVMFSGKILEYGKVEDIFARPLHPYTRGLLKSMPVLGRRAHRLPTVMDGAHVPADFPAGFIVSPHVDEQHPKGGYGSDADRLHEVEPGHFVLCRRQDGTQPAAPAPRIAYLRP